MCECTHKHKWVCVRRENQIDPLELEVEAVVSHSVGVGNKHLHCVVGPLASVGRLFFPIY